MVAIYNVKLDTAEAIMGKQQFDVGWRIKESGSRREWSEGWVHMAVGALERCAVRQRCVSDRDRSKRAKDNWGQSSLAVAASWGYGGEIWPGIDMI